MAFTAKDGKPFGNRQQMKAYDERAPKKNAAPSAENDEAAGGEEKMPQDIHEMVAEHGPAEKVEIMHHEGKHTKVSHHGGKMHTSEHASAEEAHQHGMMAAGMEPGQEEEQQSQMAGAGGMQEGGIPGM